MKHFKYDNKAGKFVAADGEALDKDAYMARVRAEMREHLAGVPQTRSRTKREAMPNGYGWTTSKRRGLKP